MLWKARGEDSRAVEKDDTWLFRAIVRHALADDDAGSRFDDPQELVFRRGGDVWALAIHRQAEDLIDMTIDDFQNWIAVVRRRRGVPHNYEIIEASAEQDIRRCRMPLDLSDFPTMTEQLVGELGENRGQSALGDVPQFYRAVVWRRCNLLIVERIPFQIVDESSVTDNFAALKVDTSRVEQWNDDERWVSFDGQKCRIDGAYAATVSIAMNCYVRVAILLRWAVDVAELRRSHATEPELKYDTFKRGLSIFLLIVADGQFGVK